MSRRPIISPTRMKIARLDNRLAKLTEERDALLRALAAEEGFVPCDDCFNGWCSMNCSSAPIYMKVLV